MKNDRRERKARGEGVGFFFWRDEIITNIKQNIGNIHLSNAPKKKKKKTNETQNKK